MDEKMLERVDALAAKLGTTAEYLWQVMVEDVVRRGVVGAALFMIGAAAMSFVAWKLSVAARAYRPKNSLDDASFMLWLSCGVVATIAAIFVGFGIESAMEAASPHITAWEYLTK